MTFLEVESLQLEAVEQQESVRYVEQGKEAGQAETQQAVETAV